MPLLCPTANAPALGGCSSCASLDSALNYVYPTVVPAVSHTGVPYASNDLVYDGAGVDGSEVGYMLGGVECGTAVDDAAASDVMAWLVRAR